MREAATIVVLVFVAAPYLVACAALLLALGLHIRYRLVERK